MSPVSASSTCGGPRPVVEPIAAPDACERAERRPEAWPIVQRGRRRAAEDEPEVGELAAGGAGTRSPAVARARRRRSRCRVRRRPSMPGLEPAPACEREAAPDAPVELHEPWRAIAVTEELEHEQPAPTDVAEEPLRGLQQLGIDRVRGTADEAEPCGSSMRTRRCALQATTPSAARSRRDPRRCHGHRLHQQRRVPLAVGEASELDRIGRHARWAGRAARPRSRARVRA